MSDKDPLDTSGQGVSHAGSEAIGPLSTVWLKGMPASPGLARGRLFILERPDLIGSLDKVPWLGSGKEIQRVDATIARLADMLSSVAERQDHEDARELAEVQLQMLQDPELVKNIHRKIKKERMPGDLAVQQAFNETIRFLQSRKVTWVMERAIDIANLRDQVISLLRNLDLQPDIPEGSILFAEELSMGEILEHAKGTISAILLRRSGRTSHAVILAQALGIPAVTGFKFHGTEFGQGMELWVDGSTGEVVLNPDAKALADYESRSAQMEQTRLRQDELVGQASVTRCGTPFTLRANIDVAEELDRMKRVGARGVGLLRTESLLVNPEFATPAARLEFYRRVIRESAEDGATIRLFDIGGDKVMTGALKEANPFLGWRGIRLLLDEHHLLQEQLEALTALAAEFPSKVRLLLPMVSDVSEVLRIRDHVAKLTEPPQAQDNTHQAQAQDNTHQTQAREDAPPPATPLLGVMIEVPSAVLQMEAMAPYVEFFSIGTNDLTQYLLATDRGNDKVSHLYDNHHPAVWKFIQMAAQHARNSARPIAVCGEMASDPILAGAFLGLGITDLSMHPSAIPAVKEFLCSRSLDELQELSVGIMTQPTASEASRMVELWKHRHLSNG